MTTVAGIERIAAGADGSVGLPGGHRVQRLVEGSTTLEAIAGTGVPSYADGVADVAQC